jgi:hypothetical protein
MVKVLLDLGAYHVINLLIAVETSVLILKKIIFATKENSVRIVFKRKETTTFADKKLKIF